MQNYFLHHQVSPSFTTRNLQSYRINNKYQNIVGSRGSYLQIYRLLQTDITFQCRYHFYANIQKILVVPSKHHQYDYLWILDTKGRFCFWHPSKIDIIDNSICWEDFNLNIQNKQLIFCGIKYQFEQKNTEGNIFFTNSKILIILKFHINEQGIYLDKNNMIKYSLPNSKIRYVNWIHHLQSLFLIGFILEQELKTVLCVYDLEKGLGVCQDSLQWCFQKVNLLHFRSVLSSQILIVTFNEVSLHNYKHSSPLKSYRTRGNYGLGFYLQDQGLYGHIGQQLVLFNRDKLITHGQVKSHNFPFVSRLSYLACHLLGVRQHFCALGLETCEGETYLLKVSSKKYSINRIFNKIGNVIQICPLKVSEGLFAVVSEGSGQYQINMIQKQLRVQIRQESKLIKSHVNTIFCVNGGNYIIICNEQQNEVFRLNRNQKYESYFVLPKGNILAADHSFIIYDHIIYEADYQCFALSILQEKEILLAQIVDQIPYYLDIYGTIYAFHNDQDASVIVMTNRAQDYCWGVSKKLKSLLTVNLLQMKTVTMISGRQIKKIGIKGHTLVCSMTSISCKNNRYGSDRIVVGYIDGKIHLHNLNRDRLYEIYVVDCIGCTPVSFHVCGEDRIIANYITKQYIIGLSRQRQYFYNMRLNYNNIYIYLMLYISKTGQIIFIDQQNEGILLKRIDLDKIKLSITDYSYVISYINRLQLWLSSPPKILYSQQRLIVAGYHNIHLINIRTLKIIRYFYHGLVQIIGLLSIKMGIIFCGINQKQQQFLFLINQQLELIEKFKLTSRKPVRYLRQIVGQNKFYLAYDDYISQVKITDNRQLISVFGSKIQIQAYQIDIIDNYLLANDPFRSLQLFNSQASISFLGSFITPYKIAYAYFIASYILCIDVRGTISVYSPQIDQNWNSSMKFIKIFSLNIISKIVTAYSQGDRVIYVTQQGQIGVVKLIDRDEFDTLKKIQTEKMIQIDQVDNFCYWQWRSRIPAHERIIDGEIFKQNKYFEYYYLQ